MAAITASVAMGLGSAYMGKKQADSQSRDIREGRDAAIASQEKMYDQTRDDLEGWRNSGQVALNNLADPQENFSTSPDYMWRRDEALRDTGNMFNMQGGGGNAMQGITRVASELAKGEYGDWWNRQFQQSEAGRGAAAQTGQFGANSANQVSAANQRGGTQLAGITGQKYENINNALVGGVSDIYATGKLKGWKGFI